MRNKCFNWLGASIIALFCAVTISQFAGAAETLFKDYGITLVLPDRWSHRDGSGKGFARVSANDGRDQANVMLTAGKGRKDTPIHEWMENQVIPTNLKWYAEGYAYHVSARKRSQIQLGTGEKAEVVEYDLFINTHRRSIVFLYWEREGNRYWARINNSGWYWDIPGSGLLKQIAEGIKSLPADGQ